MHPPSNDTPAFIRRIFGIACAVCGLLCPSSADAHDQSLAPPVIWSFQASNKVYTSPCIWNGMVFFGDADGNLFSLSASDGQLVWQRSTTSSAYVSPAVSDGLIYFATDSLYCLDANTGETVWTFYAIDFWENTRLCVFDGHLFAGCQYFNLRCFDALTGELCWTYDTNEYMRSSPFGYDDRVVVGSDDHFVHCISADSGSTVWSLETGDEVWSSPIESQGYVYVGSNDGKLYCIDDNYGTPVWTYQTAGWIVSMPCVFENSVCVGTAGGSDKSMHCVTADTGAPIWSYQTGGFIDSSPCFLNGRVFFGSEDNSIYCLDAYSGSLIWSYATGGDVGSSPCAFEDKIYVGSEDHYLYCLDSYFTGVNPDPEEPLQECYVVPNPVHSYADIQFYLAMESAVTLNLFDISGRLLDMSSPLIMSAGEQAIQYDFRALRPGIYYLRICTCDRDQVICCIVLH